MAIINGTPGDDSQPLGGNDLNGTTGNDDIFGFAGNDRLSGNLGDDFLIGGAGNDRINGGEGNDFLRGGEGNDTLSGGTGNNVLTGGTGDDYYDLSSNVTDVVIEADNGGIDRIFVSVSTERFTLPANVENLEIINNILPDNVVGNGNALNNLIRSFGGNDILSGLAGNDSLDSGGGDDILSGGTGNDTLTGGGGNDRLLGGSGNDRFRFLSSNEGVDTIADFKAADDSIQISAADFGGGLTAGRISAKQFRRGTGAVDANDRFIYNNNGALFFDVDGVGGQAQVKLATLVGVPTLTAKDIIVI